MGVREADGAQWSVHNRETYWLLQAHYPDFPQMSHQTVIPASVALAFANAVLDRTAIASDAEMALKGG